MSEAPISWIGTGLRTHSFSELRLFLNRSRGEERFEEARISNHEAAPSFETHRFQRCSSG